MIVGSTPLTPLEVREDDTRSLYNLEDINTIRQEPGYHMNSKKEEDEEGYKRHEKDGQVIKH